MRNPYRNLSSQFHVTHEKLDTGQHLLTLRDFGSSNLAAVDFDHYTDEGGSNIEIGYLKSHQEGKGHARALMEHLYQRYPQSHVDWGLTVHPAATHLANEFETKYYDRTSYQQNDGEEDDWS